MPKTIKQRFVALDLPILALILALRNVAGHDVSAYADSRMKDLLLMLLHLAVIVASCVVPVARER